MDPLRQNTIQRPVSWSKIVQLEDASHYSTAVRKWAIVNIPSNSKPTSLHRCGYGGRRATGNSHQSTDVVWRKEGV